ncbi:hypothetical protein OXX59_008514 [Metschnikowia pulcherrima]
MSSCRSRLFLTQSYEKNIETDSAKRPRIVLTGHHLETCLIIQFWDDSNNSISPGYLQYSGIWYCRV